MLDQRLRDVIAVEGETHGPDVAGTAGDHGQALKVVVVSPGIGTVDDAPTGTIPLFDQRLEDGAVEVIAHCPDIVLRDGGHALQMVTDPHGGSGNDAPTGTVPVLDQPMVETHTVIVPDRPDVAGRDGCHSIQVVVAYADVGTGDNAPFRAVPVLGQCLWGTIAGKGVADRPDVIG